MPRSAYSLMRSATSSWDPTRAVLAPPRARPTPAQRLGDLQTVGAAAVEGEHPLLALGFAAMQSGLDLGDRLRRECVEQPGLAPGVVGGVPADHMQPDPEPHGAACPAASLRIQPIFSATAAGGSPQVRYTSLRAAATGPVAAEEPPK